MTTSREVRARETLEDDAWEAAYHEAEDAGWSECGAIVRAVLASALAHRSDLLALLGPLSDEELATVAEQVGWRDGNGDILPMAVPVFASLTMRRRSCELERENDDLHDDLVKCLEVRGLALEEAATLVQPGPDGQDYIDRARLIAQWITTAYERHAEGERSGHKAWVETEMARLASRVGVSPERTDDERN